MRPRWRKVLADLFGQRTRSLLVTLSIAVGVFAVGAVGTTYTVVANGMSTRYLETRPAHITLSSSPFNPDLLAAVRRVPGVAAVEATGGGAARVQSPDGRLRDISLTARRDFASMQLNLVRLVEGRWPAEGEILIDTTTRALIQAQIDQRLRLSVGQDSWRTVTVSGFVSDLSASPGGQTVNGYVTLNTLYRLGLGRDYTSLLVRTSDPAPTETSVTAVSRRVESLLARSGAQNVQSIIGPPDRHPSASSVEGLLAVLSVLGVLAVLLGGLLTSNTFSALLTQQVRQIGVMKALGARTSQIVSMYVVMVLSLGAGAFSVSLVPALALGYGLAVFMAEAINFDLPSFTPSPWVVGVMAVLALAVPVLASLNPVLNGARVTVREAISGYGLGGSVIGAGWIDRIFMTVRGLSRPVLISLRNTFRRKARLALTLVTLVLGGAIFMGVFSVRTSMFTTINQILGFFVSDVDVTLVNAMRVEEARAIAEQVPGVYAVEGWVFAQVEYLGPDGKTVDRFDVFAPRTDSQLLRPTVIEGRWLLPEDQNAVVISTAIRQRHPEIQVGDTLTFKVNGRKRLFVVVGVFPLAEGTGGRLAYSTFDLMAEATGQVGRANSFRIGLTNSSPEAQALAAEQIKAVFRAAGIRDTQATPGSEQQEAVSTVLNVIVAFLLVMAVVIALVGGLGLMGTMSLNVMERTRETGVMRAVGAGDASVQKMVIIEGLIIALMSWAAGVALSIPIGWVMTSLIGNAVFGQPLDFIFEPAGVVIWLIVVMLVATFACLLPARSAARLTIREVLQYE